MNTVTLAKALGLPHMKTMVNGKQCIFSIKTPTAAITLMTVKFYKINRTVTEVSTATPTCYKYCKILNVGLSFSQ